MICDRVLLIVGLLGFYFRDLSSISFLDTILPANPVPDSVCGRLLSVKTLRVLANLSRQQINPVSWDLVVGN